MGDRVVGRVAPRSVEWFVGCVPTIPTRRGVIWRTPRAPTRRRLDRKSLADETNLRPQGLGGGGPRNETCGAGPRSRPAARPAIAFPPLAPARGTVRVVKKAREGGMTHHFALVLVADGDVGVLHGDVLLRELALGLLSLGLSLGLGDGARDDGAAGDDLPGLGGETGLCDCEGSGGAVRTGVR